MTSAYSVEILDDPAAVLAVAGDLLAADPVASSVVASVTHHAVRSFAAGGPRPAHPMWWAVVRDDGAVVGVSMRTMPHPPHTVWVPAVPEEAARLLARTALDHVAQAGEPPLTSANGSIPAVEAFIEETLRATGGTVGEGRPDRLWEATRIARPDPAPSGRARPATLDDLDLVTEWFAVFHTEADAQAGRPPEEGEPLRIDGARRWIDEGSVWLWDVDGDVVHLTGMRPPSFGVVRIGPVYTPPEHRGHGYASALVAEVAQRVLDAGHRVCLYTDRDNPVSNRVYAGIGFEPVLDQVNLVVDPTAAPATKVS
ncbi:GNAT family N-acetyltransferase [Promicromonospora panici]|uniref:GNAT family N-acetyltransferase n=1 Tax=Promicromonospora panici TaxID=2219658 RepID=UPI00101CC0C8|nr:GNAT family N-acetyltransferase [Promicromonospora panici]